MHGVGIAAAVEPSAVVELADVHELMQQRRQPKHWVPRGLGREPNAPATGHEVSVTVAYGVGVMPKVRIRPFTGNVPVRPGPGQHAAFVEQGFAYCDRIMAGYGNEMTSVREKLREFGDIAGGESPSRSANASFVQPRAPPELRDAATNVL